MTAAPAPPGPLDYEYPYLPFPKQLEFHQCGSDEVLFGGAGGPGKTDAVLARAVNMCLAVPNVKVLLLRRTFAELEAEILPRLRSRVPPWVAHYSSQGRVFTFAHNGARLQLGYLERDDDMYRYIGAEYALIIWDELTQQNRKPYVFLRSRLRAAGKVAEDLRKIGWRPQMIATTNPGGRGHCVPYGEVMTPAGWADITTVRVGDPVYEVDPAGRLVASTVEQVHRSRERVLQVDARGLHMAVTPGHRVAKVGGRRGISRGSAHTMVPFEELPGQATILRTVSWEGTAMDDVQLPRPAGLRETRRPQPGSLTGRQYAELLGWWLTEGSLVGRRDRAVSIAQMKAVTRERLRVFLEDDCGFHVSWSATQATIYSAGLHAHLAAQDFGMCREKYVPRVVLDATEKEQRAFFTAAIDGDGSWATRDVSGRFWTSSRRFADDMAELAVKLGYIVSISRRQRLDRVGPAFAVSFKLSKSGGTELLTGQHVYDVGTETLRRSDVAARGEQDVFCIGTPLHHTFVIRQRGSVWVSGNSWVKSMFVDPAPPGVEHVAADGLSRTYIPARARDNPALDLAAYEKQLMSLDPDMRRAIMDGDWSVLEGVRFAQFRYGVHVVAPYEVPVDVQGMALGVGVDWGIQDPFVALWGALLPDRRLVVYREVYRTNLTSAEQARLIRASERPDERIPGRPIPIALDPSCWNRQSESGLPPVNKDTPPAGSIASYYRDVFGSQVRRAYNARVPGWALVDEYLRVREDGLPGLLIYDTCTNLIRDLPSVQRSNVNPEDVDTKDPGDHSADALRYLLQLMVGDQRRPGEPLHNGSMVPPASAALAATGF